MNNYFDYAASTAVSASVSHAMSPWETEKFSNSMASHTLGIESFKAVERARFLLAQKIGAMPSEIIFTSGASESNNLAFKGLAFANIKNKGHIITTTTEHKCILNTCAFLEDIGFTITYLSPNAQGIIQPARLVSAMRDDTFLVSVHHVNNELGTIQPVRELGAIAFERGVIFHTDAAQSFCKLDINVDDMNIDMLSLSGHKIYGPKGIGALFIRDARNSDIVPLIHGGGQENGLRGGTHPTPLIVGLAAAVESFPRLPTIERNTILARLGQYGCRINSDVHSIPNIISVTFNDEQQRQRFFAENKWLVSQGSACNSSTNSPSHVLTAIGFNEQEARLTYRVSLPPYYCG